MEYNLRRLRYYDLPTEILTLVYENTYTDYLHRYEWALRYGVMLKKQTSEYIMEIFTHGNNYDSEKIKVHDIDIRVKYTRKTFRRMRSAKKPI